uniref:Uncharacterized protein n=1 Tax=Timema bartmani TaxID=61472 RepID=A0A7R9FBP3_9NEOP|nr:unnamed protein product [Timema bartmani]
MNSLNSRVPQADEAEKFRFYGEARTKLRLFLLKAERLTFIAREWCHLITVQLFFDKPVNERNSSLICNIPGPSIFAPSSAGEMPKERRKKALSDDETLEVNFRRMNGEASAGTRNQRSLYDLESLINSLAKGKRTVTHCSGRGVGGEFGHHRGMAGGTFRGGGLPEGMDVGK